MATNKEQYEVTYTDPDGYQSIWKYDLTKSKGPISVEHKYPTNFFKDIEKTKEAKCKTTTKTKKTKSTKT
jgi:hypothetical protein